MEHGVGITRRAFLQVSAAGFTGLTLGLMNLRLVASAREPVTIRRDTTPYGDWTDVYREKWTWDRVAKGTHHVNCWYQRCCNWNVYIKDAIVWREEQAATYPQTNPSVPDYNPRGCQKGACFSNRMYDQSRIRYPLKRVGERGQGKWKRISWDEALSEIADKAIDVLAGDGPGAIIWDEGSAGTNLGVQRTGTILDTPILETDSEFGDHHPGAAVTCGKISFASSADDLFYADLILNWGGNPTTTQIPNAHFINEARYHGARVVSIAPDLSSSSIHADLWIPIQVGSDAALGLSMAHVMIEEGIHDARFVAEQTDLGLLVRIDSGRFLRESDLEDGGQEDTFYLHDKVSGTTLKAPKSSLTLDGIDPALEGIFNIETRGRELTVTPVFSLLRKHLAQYTPEAAAKITGVSPDVIRTLARDIATAKSATLITQASFGKFYHGLEMERAQFLVFALAGQFGKKGSGINAFPNMWLSGHEGIIVGSGSLPPRGGLMAVGLTLLPQIVKMKWKGYTQQMVLYDITRQRFAAGGALNSNVFQYTLGGAREDYGSAKKWDPTLPREFKSYFKDAVEKGWQFPPRQAPRIFFEIGGNYLRRNRAYTKMLRELWPKLDLIVALDWRLSFTAMHSDYVFPAAGWYEQDTVPWTTPIAPFTQVTTRAVEPLGESRSDWEFQCLFFKTLQQRAIARGVLSFTDRSGKRRELDRVYEQFTFQRRFTEDNEEDLWREAVAIADNVGEVSWDELKKRGFHRYTGVGSGYLNIGNATDIAPHETITANTWHTERKMPWPTLTRRMQFFIDHELYVELGEQLPVHKDAPPIGGHYPLVMTGGHERWSIHAAWRDHVPLLHLQRGEPVVFLSTEDAAARHIEDGNEVRVLNDMDSFRLRAKVSPAMRPGTLIVYHAWEPFQFKDHKSQQALTPNPLNPIQLAGGYFHLQPRLAYGTPGASDRGTRVDVERVDLLPASSTHLS